MLFCSLPAAGHGVNGGDSGLVDNASSRGHMPDFEKADYCITVEFERNSESPSRVFRAMTGLIEAFEQLDRVLVESVDVAIRPVLLLEDIESGSLRAWLRAALERAPDDAISKLDWKTVVGGYLVRAKYVLLKWTDGKVQITNRQEVVELQKELHKLAEQTQVNTIPAYAPPEPRRLLSSVEGIRDALSHLKPHDKATLITAEGEARFNAEFSIPPATLEELLTKETLAGERTMILKVKKPDFLGESQWDFRHGQRAFPAKIRDLDWLQQFQNRQINVQPGDALRVTVTVEVMYGHDGEAIAERYFIDRVLGVVDLPSQGLLSLNDDAKDV